MPSGRKAVEDCDIIAGAEAIQLRRIEQGQRQDDGAGKDAVLWADEIGREHAAARVQQDYIGIGRADQAVALGIRRDIDMRAPCEEAGGEQRKGAGD